MFSMPLIEFAAGNLRTPLLILLGAVGTVLLIACANIAGLQLARASGRQHEVSIQIALGASTGRLVQQAFAESLLLAGAGVALGLVIARITIPLVLMLAPQSLVQNIAAHINGQVMGFVAVVGLFCMVLCGTAPAWQITHSRWYQSLEKVGGRRGRVEESSGCGRCW